MSRIYECMSLHEKKEMKLPMRVSLLINWLYDKDIILDFQVKTNAIINFLWSERGRRKSEKMMWLWKQSQRDVMLLVLKWKRETMSQEI